MGSFQEATKLAKECEQRGCIVTLTRKNHFKIKTPSGAIVSLAGTASDYRSLKNAKSMLKKAGVVL